MKPNKLWLARTCYIWRNAIYTYQVYVTAVLVELHEAALISLHPMVVVPVLNYNEYWLVPVQFVRNKSKNLY